MSYLKSLLLLIASALPFIGAHQALACPFCTAESLTLTEEIDSSAVVAIVTLDSDPSAIDPDTGQACFNVEHVIKGADVLDGAERINAIFFGEPDEEARYLLRGIGEPLDWSIPMPLSQLAVKYVKQLGELPAGGADRLAFFEPYLEHEDRALAQDAYDEFARAPYQDLIDLAPRIDCARVKQLLDNPEVSPSRRRLFFTMLGVCGGEDDLPWLESILTADARVTAPAAEAVAQFALATGGPLVASLSGEAVRSSDSKRKLGLDAMVACYLTLKGPEGLDLIDQRFLADQKANQSYTYSTLMAIRFIAEETQLVPMPRLLESARLLLDHPKFADQVITDLTRWEDWSVLERVVELFNKAGADDGPNIYVREPIIVYLDMAAEQSGDVGAEARAVIAKLEPENAEVFRRARSLADFGFLATGRGDTGEPGPGAQRPEPELSADADPPSDAGDAIPDPASFVEGEPDADNLADDREQPAAAPTPRPTASRQVEKPADPPSRTLLVAAPLAAALVCFGLFWVILRGGAV